MYVPILRKIINNNTAFIERVLPERGDITVKIGDKVEPFNQLGFCKVSYNQLVLSAKFKPLENIENKQVTQGTTLGKAGNDYIHAPYNGYLIKEKDTYIYKETGRDFVLLSGVWGTVKETIEGTSVLIEAPMKEFLVPLSCGNNFAGELIVFPNPSELLIGSFLENFTKNVSGKIFYIGGHISLSVIMKAKELGLSTLLAGSISKEAYSYAKGEGISIGVFEGFGELATSKIIFDELKNISNRFIFFDTEKNVLRVPLPTKVETLIVKKPLKQLRTSDVVQIFQNPYFAQIGTVDTIKESSILVKIPKVTNLVEVYLPNFFVIV